MKYKTGLEEKKQNGNILIKNELISNFFLKRRTKMSKKAF